MIIVSTNRDKLIIVCVDKTINFVKFKEDFWKLKVNVSVLRNVLRLCREDYNYDT